MSLWSYGVDRMRSLREILKGLRGMNFCINCTPVHPILHRVLWSKEIIPNLPRHYQMHQNMSFGLDGVDRVDLLEKF